MMLNLVACIALTAPMSRPALQSSATTAVRPPLKPAIQTVSMRTGPIRMEEAEEGAPPPPPTSLVAAGPSTELIQGLIAVAGGVLVHLVLGTMYCWGNLISYAPKNLLFFDGLEHPGMTPDAVQVLPIWLTAFTCGLPLGAKFSKALGAKPTTIIGCVISLIGTLIGSYQTSLTPFVLTYSVLAGLGVGLSYATPMIAGWTHFPKSRGLVSGLVLFGYGLGPFIFNKVATGMALGGVAWGSMLRKLVTIYTVISLTGAALVAEKKAPATAGAAKAAPAKGAGFKEAILSKRFLLLWLICISASTPGLTLLTLYKRFGMSTGAVIASDTFQSFVGGVAAISSAVGRVFWGNMLDKFGFQACYTTTTVVQLALLLLLPMTVASKLAFSATLWSIVFCLGGSIAMFAAVNAQVFGLANAGEIYSVLFSGFAVAALFGVKMVMALLPSLGWTNLFKVMAAMCGTAVGLLALLRKETSTPAAWEK